MDSRKNKTSTSASILSGLKEWTDRWGKNMKHLPHYKHVARPLYGKLRQLDTPPLLAVPATFLTMDFLFHQMSANLTLHMRSLLTDNKLFYYPLSTIKPITTPDILLPYVLSSLTIKNMSVFYNKPIGLLFAAVSAPIAIYKQFYEETPSVNRKKRNKEESHYVNNASPI